MTANSQTFGALTTDTNTVNMNIDNLVATGNVGTQGGGFSELFNAEMTLTVSNSIFTGNAAGTSQGGGFYYTCAACPIGPTLTFKYISSSLLCSSFILLFFFFFFLILFIFSSFRCVLAM